MRFEFPSRLGADIQARALDVARRFLDAVGFTHGLFNMEFFYDAAHDTLGVIEFNPRLASQFSDLYLRVLGLDLHAVVMALAHRQDPATLVRTAPDAGTAASFVYRSFEPDTLVHQPSQAQQDALARQFPEALLFCFAKTPSQVVRDFKWLGSYRYGSPRCRTPARRLRTRQRGFGLAGALCRHAARLFDSAHGPIGSLRQTASSFLEY
jgi:hypothetical protein